VISLSNIAPLQRRLTSSGRHPRSGVPLPQRLVVRKSRTDVNRAFGTMLPTLWQANVRKVKKCTLPEYDGGRGLKTVYESRGQEKRHCHILCDGSLDWAYNVVEAYHSALRSLP